ncbi:MAG: DNA-directed RNA polymerase subunit omega [Clostridia bacterium]|nr:DNA-directed RNA polymerase subunit omega [Clostridia bacterium]
MLNPDFRNVLKNRTSRYSLVTAIAKRAREITDDNELKIKCGDVKPVTYALTELIDGEIEIVEPEEIRNI